MLPGNGYKIALMDLGAKYNIANSRYDIAWEVTINPADRNDQEIIKANQDGII